MATDIMASFYKSSDGISDDANKFHTYMSNKIHDAQTAIDTILNKVNENT